MKRIAMMGFLTLLCGALQTTLGQQGLRLSLWCDEDTFLESQQIWVRVVLANESTSPQEVHDDVVTDNDLRGVQFRLEDNAGNVRTATGGILDFRYYPPGTKPTVVIAPRDSISRMFEIVYWFRITPRVPRYLFTQNYLRAGSYTLQAIQFIGNDTIYSNFVVLGKRNSPEAKNAKEEYAKHTLHSNVVRFTVVKPRGKELEAWKALAEADRRYASDASADATIEAYERVVRSFPTSVYAPYVYSRLIFIHSYAPQKNYQKVFELIRRLAEAFPDHPQSLHLVSAYAPLIFREGESELLQRLSQNLPTTKVGRLSKQILQDKETILDRARGVVTRRKP